MTTEFFNVLPVKAALDSLFAQWAPTPRTRPLATRDAQGYVLASMRRTPIDLPVFPPTTREGNAARETNTSGAPQSLPASLPCFARAPRGAPADLAVGIGQAAEIF